MEGREGSVLDAIYEDDEQGVLETLDYDDEDVEMIDADADADAGVCKRSFASGRGDHDDEAAEGGGGLMHAPLKATEEAVRPQQEFKQMNQSRSASKKRNKKKRRRNGGSAPNITNINRFVIDTCRRLKEKKSYLVWDAVGCLGVSAVSDLVKEVDAIQGCGGQKTADGKRFRNGGGILWNILKTREPKAYKEIMAKGREFEKQLLQPKNKEMTDRLEAAAAASQTNYVPHEAAGGEVLNSSERMPEVQHALEPLDSDKGRVPVRERIRVPVSYDDLFEEGEIHE